jgi:hypothetical protein
MPLDCKQCANIFVNFAYYKETWLNPAAILPSAALGCQICSILRSALEQLAYLAPDDQVTGLENRRMLHDDARITPYGTLIPSGSVQGGTNEFLFYYLTGNTPFLFLMTL